MYKRQVLPAFVLHVQQFTENFRIRLLTLDHSQILSIGNQTSGNFGLFLYGFLERFLIPTGLHHLIYTPFQFSALGNSLTRCV